MVATTLLDVGAARRRVPRARPRSGSRSCRPPPLGATTAGVGGAGRVRPEPFVRLSEVRMEGVGKRYGDAWAVQDVSMSIRPGEFYTLLGPPGSGKTTLLRMLAGLAVPDTGRIFVDDAARRPGAAVEAERRHGLRAATRSGRTCPSSRMSPSACASAAWRARRSRGRSRRRSPRSASTAWRRAVRRSCPRASSSGWRSRGRL